VQLESYEEAQVQCKRDGLTFILRLPGWRDRIVVVNVCTCMRRVRWRR